MHDVTATIDTYLAMWNERDPDARARLIEKAWTDDGSYVDPLLSADGHAELSAMVEAVQTRFPEHRFQRTSGVDAHHDLVRVAWRLVRADGDVAVAGIDVGEVADDGRLQRIVGFFGELPPMEAA